MFNSRQDGGSSHSPLLVMIVPAGQFGGSGGNSAQIFINRAQFNVGQVAIVGREELRQKLWAEDIFVDFAHSLNTAIQRLREVLGDSAESPRYIETLPRVG